MIVRPDKPESRENLPLVVCQISLAVPSMLQWTYHLFGRQLSFVRLYKTPIGQFGLQGGGCGSQTARDIDAYGVRRNSCAVCRHSATTSRDKVGWLPWLFIPSPT